MNKIKAFVCFLTVLAGLLLGGCGGAPMVLLDEGAAKFAQGKIEEDYYLTGFDELLDDLIDQYSGSYYKPTGGTMTDDEYDDAKKELKDPADGDSTDTAVYQVSSYDELVEAFHKTYDATGTYLEYTCVNNYSVDIASTIQDIYDAIQRVDPIDASGVEQWQWYEQNGITTVKISYFYDRDEFIRMKQETRTLVEQFADSVRDKGTTDYELICAVNKALCDKVVYPASEPYAPVTHTAYGALKDGLAVCEGYACAAFLVLEELGVDCDIQVGVCSNGEGHAWNLVLLEGNWYQMDVTWNDGSADITDYLLVTDDFMKRSRTWEESNYPKTPPTPYVTDD